jgi:hypothetical protein
MLRGVRIDVLPAIVAILLIGLRISVYDCALNILYFPLFYVYCDVGVPDWSVVCNAVVAV